jgi:lysozyme
MVKYARALAALLCIGVFSSVTQADDFRTIDHVASQSLIENFGKSLGVAGASNARPMLPIGLDLVRYFEGWEATAYNDPSGYCTIGYGHLIALKRCGEIDLGEFKDRTLTEDEGLAILEKDTAYARISVGDLVTGDLTNEEFSALASFVFNVGSKNFENSSMLTLLNGNDKESASTQFSRWIKSNGVVLSGLKTRRACERTLFDEDLSYGSSGKFEGGLCSDYGVVSSTASFIDIEAGER